MNLVGQAMRIAARTTTKLGALVDERLVGLDDLEVSKRPPQPPDPKLAPARAQRSDHS